MKKFLLMLFLLLSACTTIPEGLQPISGFEVNRYMGKWYEIARLDNRFERGLKQITAEYSLRDDGGVNVINSGVNIESGKRESAEGKAYFIDKPDIGSFKVSFFGPFYGGYHIIDLDKKDYRYALIAGSDRSYLWILAREPKLDDAILQSLISKAKLSGFNTGQLLYPEQ
jgi:apolipoprotein D and lipocalin family protein